MRRRSSAFTVAEVLLSIGLLSVALLAVIGLFTSAIRMQAQQQERDAAMSVGRRLLERIISEPGVVPAAPRTWIGGEPPSFTPFELGPPAFPPGPYPYEEEGGYSLDVYLQNSTRPGLKLVKVVVRWDNGKQISLQTFIPI